MIGTIGSLVQETSHLKRWLISTTLYTIACLCTSILLGLFLGLVGYFVHFLLRPCIICDSTSSIEYIVIGLLAVGYALSDIGFFRLPRPHILAAVPVTWWRWWNPYGAALAYGAALGLGIMTRVQFGTFYILCLWCVLKGTPIYSMLLMGTYGIIRALTLLPTSLYVYRSTATSNVCFTRLLTSLEPAKLLSAITLTLFGTSIILSALRF